MSKLSSSAMDALLLDLSTRCGQMEAGGWPWQKRDLALHRRALEALQQLRRERAE